MDGRYRRSVRFLVTGAVTAALMGSALLPDGFSAFRIEPEERRAAEATQVDDSIVITMDP
jgi:hypothetical protein